MIPVYRPTIKRKDMDTVLSCMVSDSIGPGAFTHELENFMAEYLQAAGTVALSSYYIALMVAIESLELEEGAGVIVSALSPVIYETILEALGLKPIIVDVDLNTGVIGPAEIEPVLEQNPKAILLHYNQGIIPDLEKILEFEIPIIEDISQALGAKIGDQFLGTFGQLAVLSLNPESIITTAAGGMIIAHDKKNLKSIGSVKELVRDNLALSNMNASMGTVQMKEIEYFLERRKSIYTTFKQALMKSKHKTPIQHGEIESCYPTFPVILKSGIKEVQKYCRKKNIDIVPAFADSIIAFNDQVNEHCGNARNLLMRTILFPLYPMLSKSNVNLISKVLSTLP